MKYYLLAVGLGAFVYMIGVAAMDGGEYPIGSVVFSAGVAGIALGVRALVRLALPSISPLKVALASSFVLLLLVLLATFGLSSEGLPHGRAGFFIFWFIYLSAIQIGLTWSTLVQSLASRSLGR